MTLEYRNIGNTDITVSSLGFGGAPLGAVGERLSNEAAAEIVSAAAKGGISYFDVAPLYGHGLSEKRLGAALKHLPRDAFALSTKVGRLLVPTGQGYRDTMMRDQEPVEIVYDYSYDGARKSLEASIERLGVPTVDILLCHDIDQWTHGEDQPEVYGKAAQGILPALAELKRQGVVKAFGIGVNEWQVGVRAMQDFDLDCILLAGRFTLLEQEALTEFLPMCIDRQVSVIIGGPYNSGLLAQTERRRATYNYKPVDDERWNRAQAIRAICTDHSVDLRAAALQYPLQHPAVASVIPGVWSLQEVTDNLSLIDTEIPDSLWSDLANAGLAQRL